MLQELFEKLTSTIRQADLAKVIEFDERTKIVQQGDKLEWRNVEAKPRSHEVETFASFVDAAKNWGAAKGVVWHKRNSVELVANDQDDRLDRICATLTDTAPFELLETLAAEKRWMPHRDFVLMLRHDLTDVFDVEFVRAVRSIDFQAHDGAISTVDRGRDTLGRSVDAVVSNMESLDRWERVFAKVDVYEERDWFVKRSVECMFDVDPTTRKLMLRPIAGQIENAIDDTHQEIQTALSSALKEAKIPVFRGNH